MDARGIDIHDILRALFPGLRLRAVLLAGSGFSGSAGIGFWLAKQRFHAGAFALRCLRLGFRFARQSLILRRLGLRAFGLCLGRAFFIQHGPVRGAAEHIAFRFACAHIGGAGVGAELLGELFRFTRRDRWLHRRVLQPVEAVLANGRATVRAGSRAVFQGFPRSLRKTYFILLCEWAVWPPRSRG